MQKDNAFFEDLARMATAATGGAMALKREMEAMVSAQMEKFSARAGSVSREEFEVVKAMAEKARQENEALTARLDALEKHTHP